MGKKKKLELGEERKEQIDHMEKKEAISALEFSTDCIANIKDAKENDQDLKNLQAEVREINKEYKESIEKRTVEIDYLIKHLAKRNG